MALLNLADLIADRDHRRDEPVDFGEVLAFGRLDHQRAGDRKAEGWGVEAVVDQPLGNIFGGDATGLLQWPQVEDALVGHPTTRAGIERGVVVAELHADVVRRKDCRLRRMP